MLFKKLGAFHAAVYSVSCSDHLVICPIKIANKVIHTFTPWTEWSIQYYVPS